jgi:hypothetical protein
VIGVVSRRLGFGLAGSIVLAVFGGVGLVVAVVTVGVGREGRALERARQAFENRFPAGSSLREDALSALRRSSIGFEGKRRLFQALGESLVQLPQAPEEQLQAGLADLSAQPTHRQAAAVEMPAADVHGLSMGGAPDREKLIPLEPFTEEYVTSNRAEQAAPGHANAPPHVLVSMPPPVQSAIKPPEAPSPGSSVTPSVVAPPPTPAPINPRVTAEAAFSGVIPPSPLPLIATAASLPARSTVRSSAGTAVLWTIAGVVGAGLVLGLGFCAIIVGQAAREVNREESAKAVVQAQLDEVRSGSIDAAYGRLSGSYRPKVSREAFEVFVSRHPGLMRADSTLTVRYATETAAEVAVGSSAGSGREAGAYRLAKEAGEWRVSGMELGGDRPENARAAAGGQPGGPSRAVTGDTTGDRRR